MGGTRYGTGVPIQPRPSHVVSTLTGMTVAWFHVGDVAGCRGHAVDDVVTIESRHSVVYDITVVIGGGGSVTVSVKTNSGLQAAVTPND